MKKYHTLILPRVWLKTKITQIHALAKTRNHCFDQYILYHQHSYTNSALLQRRILVLGKHVGSKNDERLVWKQLCARNKVFNRLEALHRKPSLSIVFNTSSKTKKYICTLTFYQATWLTYRESWFKWVTAIRITLINFWICEPLARCAKRGSSLPLGTPMEIDFTSAYLHYPLPQCSKINCHSDNFLEQLRAFPPPFGQSPSGLPITQDFWLMLNGKVDPEQWTISWYVRSINTVN